MSLYITGDVHGNVRSRFNFKFWPELMDCTKDDDMLILGDFGLPFGINHPAFDAEQTKKDFHYMFNAPWGTTYALLGNHDDRDFIADFDSYRQDVQGTSLVKVGNIIYIDVPCVLDIQGHHCLCIPGAKSHDMWARTEHLNWWANEEIDIGKAEEVVSGHCNDSFDFVFTHDSPGHLISRFVPTEGEEYLDEVADSVDFGRWFFGHMHRDNLTYEYHLQKFEDYTCLYDDIVKVFDGGGIQCL